jgi:hypothetical protein
VSPLALVALALGARAATPAEVPDAAAAWAVRLDRVYANRKARKPTVLDGVPIAMACPGPGAPPSFPPGAGEDALARYAADPSAFEAACQARGGTGWMLRVDLLPTDRQRFAPAWVKVVRAPSGDARADLSFWLEQGVAASRGGHLVAASGPWLVELHLPCGVEPLVPYEIGDFLGVFSAAPALPEPLLAWSPCAAEAFRLLDAAQARAAAAAETELRGLRFPAARAAVVELPDDDDDDDAKRRGR